MIFSSLPKKRFIGAKTQIERKHKQRVVMKLGQLIQMLYAPMTKISLRYEKTKG